jgi:protein CMS1
MKVDEQVDFLKNKKTGIGVGTPARLIELIDNGETLLLHETSTHCSCILQGALSLDNLQRLIVDASHIDQKKRGVMDMKDTMMPLARFLTKKELKEKYTDEKKPLALLFY